METVRGPLQGVGNVVRFNWHFYVLAVAAVAGLGLMALSVEGILALLCWIAATGIVVLTTVSLWVTYWVYDLSNLYGLGWLPENLVPDSGTIVNIHAGFDETSGLLHRKYPTAQLVVLDFYDPAKHTEVSLQRARKAYPPYPGTLQTVTAQLPLADASVDVCFAILAAHEVRDEIERIAFFKEMHRVLKPEGRVVVTEHLRDTANFAAYNLGAFHFHAKPVWLRAFAASGFIVGQETKITPFISTFILRKHGTAS